MIRSKRLRSTPIAARPDGKPRRAFISRSDAKGTEIADALREMNARLGLPPGLAAMGVERSLFERIIDGAMADHCHKTNPRIATRDEYREMLEQSM